MNLKCTGRSVGGALALVVAAWGCGSDSDTPGGGIATQTGGATTTPGTGGFGAPGTGGVTTPGTGGVSFGTGGFSTGGISTPGTGGLSAGGGAGAGEFGGTDMSGGGVLAGTGGVASDGGIPIGGEGPTGGGGPPVMEGESCTGFTLPPVTDYGARGPFRVERENRTGPGSDYTMFRPATLGEDGFLHPPLSWGNGVTTTPDLYVDLLETVASHGFVVIATNSAVLSAPLVRDGLQWLIDQNTGGGELAGKLAVDCAATFGYSMGGGAAVGAGSHPNVVATVSLHGLGDAAERVSGPLLLVTSTGDDFVSKAVFVAPTYNRSSTQPTLMVTLDERAARNAGLGGHLIPLGNAGDERAPSIAWFRYWIYGDEGAREWFFGSDCTLCRSPWQDIERKNHSWD